jgi:hypothetical protein
MAYSPEVLEYFDNIQAYITHIEDAFDLQQTKERLLADRAEQLALADIRKTLLQDRQKRLTKTAASKTSGRYTKLRNNHDLLGRNIGLIKAATNNTQKELDALNEKITIDPEETPDQIFEDYNKNDFELKDAYTDNDLRIISYFSLQELKTELLQIKEFYSKSKRAMSPKNLFKHASRGPVFFSSRKALFSNDGGSASDALIPGA